MSAEVVDSNPYSRLMALQRMGIVKDYEKIREKSVSELGIMPCTCPSPQECTSFSQHLWVTWHKIGNHSSGDEQSKINVHLLFVQSRAITELINLRFSQTCLLR